MENDFPSDGLVLIYDDIAYGISLGRTAKFREIRLPLNGQTKKQRPGFYTLNGVRQEPVLLIRLPCLSQ